MKQKCTVTAEELTAPGLALKSNAKDGDCKVSNGNSITIDATTECNLQCKDGFFASSTDVKLKCDAQTGDQDIAGKTVLPTCQGA